MDGYYSAASFPSPGTGSFLNSTFTGNIFSNDGTLPTSLIKASVEAESDSDSNVSLKDCTLDSTNIVDHELISSAPTGMDADTYLSATIYSDEQRGVWVADTPDQTTLPLDSIPVGSRLLSGDEEWLLDLQQASTFLLAAVIYLRVVVVDAYFLPPETLRCNLSRENVLLGRLLYCAASGLHAMSLCVVHGEVRDIGIDCRSSLACPVKPMLATLESTAWMMAWCPLIAVSCIYGTLCDLASLV